MVRRRLAALALALASIASLAATPPEPVARTTSVRATAENGSPTRAYEPPTLLIHPHDPATAVAGTIELTSGLCNLLRTRDGGRTWSLLDNTPSPHEFPLCFRGAIYGYLNETPMDWGRDGALYWGITGFHPDRQDRDVSVLVARSPDLGDSWTSTVVADGRAATEDPPFVSRPVTGLAVDSRSADEDIVYVGWQTYPPDSPRLPKVAVSTDGGRTFSESRTPYDEATARHYGGEGGLEGLPPQLRVAGDGTLYVLFPGRPTDRALPPRILLARSTDRGATFTVTEVAEAVEPNTSPTMRWSPDGGPHGTLHVVFEDRRERPLGTRDIFYTRSTDAGATFSPPLRLNDDDPLDRFTHLNPAVSVAPDGRLDVVWWDFRDGAADYATDVYYAYSTDSGATWSRNFRITDRSIDRRVGTWSNNFDFRGPPAVASTDATALIAWDDTRLATSLSGTQDIVTTIVQLAVLPGDRSALPYLVAAVTGLAAGGLALLLVAVAVRRRDRAATGERPAAAAVAPKG